MPYGSEPYGAAPYGGSAVPDAFQAGDLLDEGEVGQPAIPETLQCGDLTDGGEVGQPELERDWSDDPTTETPTVPPEQVEAAGQRFPELVFEVVELTTHAHVCWLPWVLPDPTVRGARDDPGSIAVELSHSDPNLDEITYSRMIRAWFQGQLVAKALIEPRDDTTKQPHISQQRAKIGGRGGKAYLEQIIVGPVYDGLADGSMRWFPHTKTHRFDWSHPALDASGWPLARSKGRQGSKTPHWTGYPRSWLDRDAHWMSGALGSADNAPDGYAYLHLTYVVGFGGARDEPVATMWTGDNLAQLVIDGYDLGQTNDWQQLQQHDLPMSAGVHVARARIVNQRQAVTNPMGLLVSQRRITGQGKLGPVLMRTTPDAAFSTSPAQYWRCLQFPTAPPSWTAGGIIRYLLALAYLRAVSELGSSVGVPLIRTSFTALTDSAGRRWPPLLDWSVPVGHNMLQVVSAFEESLIDCDMASGSWTLHAWVKNTRTRSVAFSGPVDVTHRSQPPIGNSLTIGYADNVARVSRAIPAGDHRREAFLSIPQVRTEAGAEAIGAKILANFGRELVEYQAKIPHDSAFLSPRRLRERDVLPLPNRAGVNTNVKVLAWTITQDKAGRVSKTIEAGDRVMQVREAIHQWLDNIGTGALGGKTAQSSQQIVDSQEVTKRTRQTTSVPYQRDADITATLSHPLPIDNFSILLDAQARLGEGEAVRGSDTHAEVYVNGAPTGDVCTIPAGQPRGRLVDLNVELDRDDDVQLRIAETGFAVIVVLRFT